MAADSGLKNLQCSDTKCWGQGRQCGSKSNTLCDEELAYRRNKTRYAQREREIGTKNKLYSNSNDYNNNNNNNHLYKGYKVTLYSDSIRSIALPAIYINGIN